MRTTPATTAERREALRGLRGLLERVHALWGARLLEPTDFGLQNALEETTDALMIGAGQWGVDPHRWCPDRYCDCHLTLWSRHPQLEISTLSSW